MNAQNREQAAWSHRLIQWGVVLFLMGLLTGFLVPTLENPRMGLTSHLEGVLNGILLIVFGLLWPRLRLGARTQAVAVVLAVYGAYANWATTLLAAVWGAGEPMMPLAAKGHMGSGPQEALILFGLLSLSVAMIILSGIVLWGLRLGPLTAADKA